MTSPASIDLSAVTPLLRGQTFEEMVPGSIFRTASRTITESDLIAFVTLAGLQSGSIHGTGMAFMRADVDIKGPLFVGDTITVVVEVLESRPAKSGARGIVTTRNSVVRVDGTVAVVYEPVRMIRGRAADS
jgi:hypothetical protein